jgi:P4 family phage/plasmid primase-like protien
LLLCGTGNNGKGGFTALLEALVGYQNCSHQGWNELGERFGLGPTLGRLLNLADECERFNEAIEGRIKWYTNGKALAFEFKGKDKFDAHPTARLVVACNTPPRIADKTDGMWRRMVYLPFTRKIAADRKIADLDSFKWWEANVNMSAVLGWALAGLARLRANNWRFTQAVSSIEAKESFSTVRLDYDYDPAAMFLRESVAADPEGRDIASADLFDRYREWCSRGGFHPLNSINFGVEVKRLFPDADSKPRKVKGQVAKYWHGLRKWAPEPDPLVDWSGIWNFGTPQAICSEPIDYENFTWTEEDALREARADDQTW